MATVEDLPVIDKILSRLGSSKSYKANSTARVGSIEWRTKTNDSTIAQKCHRRNNCVLRVDALEIALPDDDFEKCVAAQ
jgi:hypothetical protein